MKSAAKLRAVSSNKKGITLIALIITIIVLLILAGVSLSLVLGDSGIFDRSTEASFKTNFKSVEEQVVLYQGDKLIEHYDSQTPLSNEELLPIANKITEDEIGQFKSSLTEEIKYISGEEEITNLNLYHLDKNKIDMPHDYIIDIDSMQIYDVPGARYSKKWHHTLDSIGFDNIGPSGSTPSVIDPVINDDDDTITTEGDIGWYAPNVKGFNNKYTTMVYYNSNNTCEIPIKEYIEGGKSNKVTKNGTTYYLDKYDDQMWANAKTTANGLEAWWVWVPRYAYKVNASAKQMEIIFVTTEDAPIGKISDYDRINGTTTTDFATEYTVHPAFNKGDTKLKGIWVAKSHASNNMIHEMDSDSAYPPNLNGFDRNNTYIELYNSTEGTFDEEVLMKDANLGSVNNDNKWYDYSKKQWANIKTNANGLEAWWVWIPRYAYQVSEANKEMNIIFIDTNDKPYDKENMGQELPDNFIVHPAFNKDNNKKLKGIWVAKNHASNNTTHEMDSNLAYPPNLDGFDPNYTYIELFDTTVNSFNPEEILLSDANLSTINNDNRWYDYSKKQWANIKTTANGLEAWWVWIPRYAYQVSEANKEISIIFIDINDKPMDTEKMGNELPDNFIVHPAFNKDNKKLKGIWVAKFHASNVSDVITGTSPTGASTLPKASDQAGNTHEHVANGAGTTERFVTNSTKWCTSYDGTPCSNNGYYIYCSECGVRLRHYWCKNHYNKSTKVIIDDSNIN